MSPPKKNKKGIADEIDKIVGQRLKTRRAIKGLSQEKLAENIGLTFQQIQKYESGTNRISASRLYQFAKILNVPVNYFFSSIDNSESSQVSLGFADNSQEEFKEESLETSREAIELVKAYYAIKNPAVRKNIMGLMRSLSDK